MCCVLLKDLETNEYNNQSNYLIIQNKGTFYKALDLNKVNSIIMILYYCKLFNFIVIVFWFQLKYDLKQICNFDIKLLSNYTALVAFPFMYVSINYLTKYNVHIFFIIVD